MTERTRLARYAALLFLTLFLGGCFSSEDDENIAANGPQVSFTNPAGADVIQTPDIAVNITGTAQSDVQIQSVEWTNDRGGRGVANGKENWVTGNIVLQIGTNNITITATDADGDSSSKNIAVERENPTAPIGGDSEQPEAFFSYRSDLSGTAPVDGADIKPGMVYFQFSPGTEWPASAIAYVEYQCCRGISGPGEGEPFGSPQPVSQSPWSLGMDLSALEPGGTRRLRTDIYFRDGSASETRVFDFTVAGAARGNAAPEISGQPPSTATVGMTYSFLPTATDTDGDTVSFSIENKPSWATFNRRTGRLSGTPGAGDAGTYNNIVISASDGNATDSLPAFVIVVVQSSSGSATVSWDPPTVRMDGTSLGAGLAGYEIQYGQSRRNYTETIRINNAGITSYVVENLAPGTWHFAVVAIDKDGQRSDLSNNGQITIP